MTPPTGGRREGNGMQGQGDEKEGVLVAKQNTRQFICSLFPETMKTEQKSRRQAEFIPVPISFLPFLCPHLLPRRPSMKTCLGGLRLPGSYPIGTDRLFIQLFHTHHCMPTTC